MRKPRTRYRKECPKCGDSIGAEGFNRHVKSCDGIPKAKKVKALPGRPGHRPGNKVLKARRLGLPEPIMSEETRAKIGASSRGRRHTLESRQKISLARATQIEEMGGDRGGFRQVKNYPVLNNLGELYICKGMWERDVAEWLNNQGIIWVRKIYISYMLDSGPKTYIPDFYIPAKNLYIEVKGYFGDYDKRKMKAVVDQSGIHLSYIFQEQINAIRKGNFDFESLCK
jgi:hypothetical protein